MDDPDQTAPAPRDDGQVPPRQPTAREREEMKTGNHRADPPPRDKALPVEDLNASNDK
jgi:hypothetical protein